MDHKHLSIRLAAPTVLLYAAGYPIGAATVSVMSPFLVIVLRFAASAVVLWAILAVRRQPLPTRTQVGHAIIAGLLTQGVQFLSLYWGLAHSVSAGLASLVIALNPVVTAALMAALLAHRESRRGVAALVLATAAVLLACAPKIVQDHDAGFPIIAVVIAMAGLSVGGIYQGRHCAGADPMAVTAIGLTASTPLAGIAAASAPMTCTDWPRAITLLAIMVVVSSVGATTLYAVCIKQSGARAASILFAVIPAAASVMAWITLGDRLSGLTVCGLVLGAAACTLQARTASHAPRPPGAGANESRRIGTVQVRPVGCWPHGKVRNRRHGGPDARAPRRVADGGR
ncbi:DMT family transporter [Mycobacterium sp. PDNC021]|uniref:DMT family transporter n=1 Tax=Mycobacterium sp. PDNC021 TaxID=3391399 RepID=UPI003AAE7180